MGEVQISESEYVPIRLSLNPRRGTGFQPVLAILTSGNPRKKGLFLHLPSNTGWKPLPQLRIEAEPIHPHFLCPFSDAFMLLCCPTLFQARYDENRH